MSEAANPFGLAVKHHDLRGPRLRRNLDAGGAQWFLDAEKLCRTAEMPGSDEEDRAIVATALKRRGLCIEPHSGSVIPLPDPA